MFLSSPIIPTVTECFLLAKRLSTSYKEWKENYRYKITQNTSFNLIFKKDFKALWYFPIWKQVEVEVVWRQSHDDICTAQFTYMITLRMI